LIDASEIFGVVMVDGVIRPAYGTTGAHEAHLLDIQLRIVRLMQLAPEEVFQVDPQLLLITVKVFGPCRKALQGRDKDIAQELRIGGVLSFIGHSRLLWYWVVPECSAILSYYRY